MIYWFDSNTIEKKEFNRLDVKKYILATKKGYFLSTKIHSSITQDVMGEASDY